MKCDELRDFEVVLSTEYQFVGGVVFRSKKFYSKDSVDEAIDELKTENERLTIDKRNAELRADVADQTIEKLKAKNRKLQRALWLARATALNRIDVGEYLRKHMNSKFWNDGFHTFQEACYVMQIVINNAKNACRAKAEEYR